MWLFNTALFCLFVETKSLEAEPLMCADDVQL